MSKTKEDRINTVFGDVGHVVILGAGASVAATKRNSEMNGKRLPLMDNLIEIVGLIDIVESLPDNIVATNFEKLYSKLYNDDPKSDEIREVERRVFNYFRDMKLPEEPTIYDYLVLSLRPKDLIATFNWDPLLFQALQRNRDFADMPNLAFLHGTVAFGYSKKDKKYGPAGWYAIETKNCFEPIRLLYPVDKKNYSQDEFISTEWERVKFWLNCDSTKRVTIFGYGAPKSDFEAVKILQEAWGAGDERDMEQFEIIDTKDEDTVRTSWDNFIHSHHYDYSIDYFESSLSNNPRRTVESYFQHYLSNSPSEAFSVNNPVPSNIKTLEELWEWHTPLVEAENEWKHKNDEYIE